MATKKKAATKAVSKKEASAEALAQLGDMFPQADSYQRTQFPKLVFKSQTVLDEDEETVLVKAGTFFIDRPSGEVGEDGKPEWDRKEIGKTLEGLIIYHRKRLSYWDTDNSEFHSTPMFDSNDETIPLFKAGEFICEGTPAELRAMYPEQREYTDAKTGEKKMRTVSKLRDGKVMYVIFQDELLELTIQGTSMWSFNDYLKKTSVPATITSFNSSKEENGGTKWNKMTFKAVRNPSAKEAEFAIQIGKDLLQGIDDEKAYYANKRAEGMSEIPAVAGGAQEALSEGKKDEDEDF